MFRAIREAYRNRPDDACAILWTHEGSKRTFPFYIGFGWRDRKGFRLSFIGSVTHTGAADPHLMPNGIRSYSSFKSLGRMSW